MLHLTDQLIDDLGIRCGGVDAGLRSDQPQSHVAQCGVDRRVGSAAGQRQPHLASGHPEQQILRSPRGDSCRI